MSELGELLKNARLEKGISLEDLQETTKIRKTYLEAIEEGNYKILPGNFYARAFIKSYAEAVGLEPEQVLRMYRNVIPTPNPELNIEPMRRKRRSRSNGETFSKWASAILMWSFPILILGIIYYFVSMAYTGNDNVKDDQNKLTDKTEQNTPAGTENGANSDNPQTDKPQTPADKPKEEDTPDEPVVTFVNTDKSTDVYSASRASKLLVELKVTGKSGCWIEVKKGTHTGKQLAYRTYKQGETATWDIDDSVWIRMGNPSAVELKINGQTIDTSQATKPKNIQVDLVESTVNE